MIIRITPGFKGQVNLIFRLAAKLKAMISRPSQNWQQIPVIINNFNRHDCLKKQVAWLEEAGMKKIFIIDNASTYPPLLDYYKKCPYTIFKLNRNIGHTALWDTHIQLWFKNHYYILTDPDVIPVDECPLDAVNYFKEVLEQHPGITKVGFGLKIDDLPAHYQRKGEVIEWESRFWQERIGDELYKADIDTTFALYHPNSRGQQWGTCLRTGGKLVARHLPWYENSSQPSNEELFFQQVTTKVSSWYKEEKYNG